METRAIISLYENVIIQIATPYSTGTGFYLKNFDLIITNEHVVRGNKNAVVAGKKFEKQIVPVLYADTKYDLAFLKPP
ncbi:MAG: trypsin-like peptidase domain-containing protein [Saprospiraceae bacterium]|nr:trypsin-like peptidase domain-containing protein [Saprospiraceae bacterium]